VARDDWGSINVQVADCRRGPDPIRGLRALFDEHRDGMVALALGQELKGHDPREAIEWYRRAETLFPKPQYKKEARTARERLELNLAPGASPARSPSPVVSVVTKTVFVVACSKSKIWDTDPLAPPFVPARYAYRGERFLEWRNRLEASGAMWLILSARYGFIEPDQPISNYDVTFSDAGTGPLSSESLRGQAEHQARHGVALASLARIEVAGSDTYLDRVLDAFRSCDTEVVLADEPPTS
jgi:hypothetical protein